jgi:hypothetical protein
VAASKSSLSVRVASRPSCRSGPGRCWMHCGSPAFLVGGPVPVGQHPWVLLLGVSESLRPVVVPQGQMGAVALHSSDDQEDRNHARSAEVMGRLVRKIVPEVTRGRGSSLIPCTGYFVAVMAVVFGLQMNKEVQRINEHGPWYSKLARRRHNQRLWD